MRDALKTITAILAALGSHPLAVYAGKMVSVSFFRERFTAVRNTPTVEHPPAVFSLMSRLSHSTTTMTRVGSWQSVRALPSMVRRTSRGDRVDGAYPVFLHGTIGAEL